MKRFPAATALSCAILLLLAGTLFAGALDRANVQPRTNPAAQSMIRVPGVVGQDQAAAMAAIQQAGLNPSIVEAKKVPKGMSGAKGMECKVVDQNPSAGGMAMYGTTVTVSVWKPGQCEAAAGVPTGAPSYGTPSYGSSPHGTQSAFPGSQGTGMVQQPMMPQGGSMMQGGQGFQVQQYYYPDPAGAGAPAGQGQPSAPPPQPADPYAGQPPQQAPPPQ